MRTSLFTSVVLGCAFSTPAMAWHDNNANTYNTFTSQDTFLNHYAATTPSSFRYSASENVDAHVLAQAADTSDQSINTLPMHLSVAPEKNWDYLLEQSYTIFGLSVATVGMMTLLPESVTKWDEEDRDLSGLGQKWWDNVSEGPVWDKDDHVLNYIMHPYFGGVYYTAARHSGFNEWESFLYSATMSTFFWEYGVEGFAEVPSIQDIIVTPLFGAAVGEWMFQTELEITANGGEVMGSETLGDVSLFLLNPVGHIHYWVTDWWKGDSDVSLTYSPWFGNSTVAQYAMDAGAEYDKAFIGLEMKLALQ
ncbi:ubiquitin-protein ligase [Photobacterium aphoticum]|uniref:Ubiquitin-protein ligase n=1 Tax=Photobacterium aphoticum TaxID=754436 RepID=A0A090QR98_9GAMM|nr:ubiquitin-protein ligase [Photobacterium aphoticum]